MEDLRGSISVVLIRFEVVLVRIQFPCVFRNYLEPGNFVEVQEIFKNSEIGVRETLFSEG